MPSALPKKYRRVVYIAALAVVIGITLNSGLKYLTLDSLQQNQEALALYVRENFLTATLAFVGTYITVAAFSLPGAAILTLAGGALFGLLVGTLLTSVASTIGATLAFLLSRYLLRKRVQTWGGQKLKTINEGVEREGAFYLFGLRLVPLFPFFLVNLGMGITNIRLVTYFWVSQLGMLPGTIAYVNAGTQLSQLKSLSGIVSAPVLISFAILGIVPLIAKKLVDFYRGNRLLRRFKKPESFDYNLVVIGAGSAGLVSSYIASAVKAKVALIEKHKMGGDCLNTGCVPSKALIRSAKILHYSKRAKEFGLESIEVKYNFADVMERVQRVIKTVEPHDSIERYGYIRRMAS